MTDEDVRRIIREELSKFIFSDRFFIYKNIQFADGVSIQAGLTNGLKIGTAASEKLGFFGVTPVIQQSSIADPAGGTPDAEARTAINLILDVLDNLGFTA